MNAPLRSILLAILACAFLTACGKDPDPVPAKEQVGPPASPPPPADPVPALPPEPAKPEMPPPDPKYAGYPPNIVEELKRLEEAYPQLKTDIAKELVRLKDYETALRMIEGDFDAIVKTLVPLVNCSQGGSELFFQKDRLAHEAADKLMLLTMLGKNVRTVFDLMEKRDAEASDEELQRIYNRMRAIEQCEGRLVRLTYTYKWREQYLMPLFVAAANKASDEGQLAVIRPAAKLLKMIEKKDGLISLYPEQQSGVFGNCKVRLGLVREQSFEQRDKARQWQQPQSYGLRWAPEEDCRIPLFDELRKKFQLDDVKLIDLAAIAALERDTARRLKLLELWHASLSVAGELLAQWLPKRWEQPSDEHLQGLRVLVAGAVHYEPGNPYPKAEARNPFAFVYLPEAAYTPDQFTAAIKENGKADIIRASLKKGADFPLGYSEKWTLEEFLENGKIKPLAKTDPRPKKAPEPAATKTSRVEAVESLELMTDPGDILHKIRVLIDGDEPDPLLAYALLFSPEVAREPGIERFWGAIPKRAEDEDARMARFIRDMLVLQPR